MKTQRQLYIEQQNLQLAKACLVRAERELATAQAKAAECEKQLECAHTNLDDSIFGRTCQDCKFFFNDGI